MRLNKIYRQSFFLPAVSCILLLGSCHYKSAQRVNANDENMDQIQMTTIAGGNYGAIEHREDIFISSSEEWEKLWKELHAHTSPLPPLPEVDFSRETVIAAFLGTKTTGGYGIEIIDLTEIEGKLTAAVKTRTPSPGEMVTMAITRPYHIVKVNISGKNIEFKMIPQGTNH